MGERVNQQTGGFECCLITPIMVSYIAIMALQNYKCWLLHNKVNQLDVIFITEYQKAGKQIIDFVQAISATLRQQLTTLPHMLYPSSVSLSDSCYACLICLKFLRSFDSSRCKFILLSSSVSTSSHRKLLFFLIPTLTHSPLTFLSTVIFLQKTLINTSPTPILSISSFLMTMRWDMRPLSQRRTSSCCSAMLGWMSVSAFSYFMPSITSCFTKQVLRLKSIILNQLLQVAPGCNVKFTISRQLKNHCRKI